jgi:ABC-type taurine transport system ATPase subunit
MKSLDVRDVVVRYGDASNREGVIALDHVSLTIEPGSFVVALGASGCGMQIAKARGEVALGARVRDSDFRRTGRDVQRALRAERQ